MAKRSPSRSPYDVTDRYLRVLLRKYMRLFRQAKTVLGFDELNVLDGSRKLYDEIESLAEDMYVSLANEIYILYYGGTRKPYTKKSVRSVLSDYDPVTFYVYLHEIERKRARFAEGVIAAGKSPSLRSKEIDRNRNVWFRMVKQYADDFTDRAALDAFRDMGVEKVMWMTREDERRCNDCKDRHGTIYDINAVPPKPHYNCRCWLVPVR